METREEIVMQMASERMVEKMVQRIAQQSLSDDLKDLCQMIYLILLEYDETKLQDLWTNKQMNFFVVRIILNQLKSRFSPYYKSFRKFQERSVDITGMDWTDED